MGFDLLIAGGTDNRLFSDDLLSCMVEVRVEQTLDQPTRFAVRFQDDIEDGKLKKASVPELKVGEIVTIAVDRGEDQYAELRQIVRKVRNRMPNTYQLIFIPMGQVWKLDHASDEFQNIRYVKENGALINASIADYTNPPALKQLLEEKIPLN